MVKLDFFAGVQSPCGSEFQALLRVSIWLQNAYSPVFSLTNYNTIAKPENAICKMHRAIILASCTICAFFVGCSQLYTYTTGFIAKSETCKTLILLWCDMILLLFLFVTTYFVYKVYCLKANVIFYLKSSPAFSRSELESRKMFIYFCNLAPVCLSYKTLLTFAFYLIIMQQ